MDSKVHLNRECADNPESCASRRYAALLASRGRLSFCSFISFSFAVVVVVALARQLRPKAANRAVPMPRQG
ncbi:hypothetical protein A6V36_20760 [Paraburkholderia ginsengiterrae]|uniref:Uncharacterized protein n=1 Tax=Paraburkholderia ginsengiterrae TaxID=1462993 RepID=A0A1A9NDH5_9BURK|nr:hypothetical protein A6V36_20760 [Paraburkholderia ginsengiterrae]OAJ64460.1 hypothetical protein A6V37_19785 [Paraburkholderia ginsengiterrae]